jgi:hypothetical protein
METLKSLAFTIVVLAGCIGIMFLMEYARHSAHKRPKWRKEDF